MPTSDEMLRELHVKGVLQQVNDFFEEYKYDGRPFLLIGMGPSFSHIRDFDLRGYNTLGLNKVVREIKVDLAHIIDWYIVDRVLDSLHTSCTSLLVPYFPHFGYRPSLLLPLRNLIAKHPLKDKILGYNLSTLPIPQSKSPMVHARYFSAEAALNIIALLGCKEVYAIGIDGGTGERAKEFSDHGVCDPRGFDLQWTGMANTITNHKITYKNIDGSKLNKVLQEKLWQTSSESKSTQQLS